MHLKLANIGKGCYEKVKAMKFVQSEKFTRLYTFEDLTMKDFFDELYKVMMERYYLLGFR